MGACTPEEVDTMALTLRSPVFEHYGKIPSKYTCDGENINPPLQIEGVPSSAQSLVLLMDDPDIPGFVKEKYHIEVWDHWVVFNIPPSVREIQEGKNPQGVLGKNTSGTLGYGGPCPPDREHRYFFRLYALDTLLKFPEGARLRDVEAAMKGHIITQTELIGLYERIGR